MKTMRSAAKSKLPLVFLALLSALLLTGVVSLGAQAGLADRVVRLHVLANSDSEEDQALKLLVRDQVLSQAEQLLTGTADRAEAETVLTRALPELKETAAAVIAAEGYDYDVEVRLEETSFPTKEYDGFSLPAGEYLALRVLIGEAKGQNWWCVAFPPLCLGAASQSVEEATQAGYFDADQTALITGESEGYVLKFKGMELLGELKRVLEN